jgi:glycosyltransferase involved in cell wall biosynthesis
MPWTVLEAMTAALPIVATEVGACAWMIGEHGWIVEPKQPDAIAEAVKRLFDDYGKARMKGVSARRELERRFTDDAMWEETFRALLP